MRFTLPAFASLLWIMTAGIAIAQEELHFEGYWGGLAVTSVGDSAFSDGLVTALYAPLVSNFSVTEYTYVIHGVISRGSTSTDSSKFRTLYNVEHASLTIFEDPSQDARPTFYNCPSDVVPPPVGDPRYADGSVYLTGHFVAFGTAYDRGTGSGEFWMAVNWDAGTHIGDLSAGKRGGGAVGTANGTFSTSFSCTPAGFAQSSAGRIFLLTTSSLPSTWGSLRRLYH